MPEQLSFDWPTRVRMGAETYFVSEANAAAHAMVMAPEGWPDGKLVLLGPKGAGKTHLARLFAETHGAAILPAEAIDPAAPLPAGPTVIEDADTLPGPAQEWLFHAHNHLRALGLPLLLTAQTAPSRWPLTLPDLVSRLSATTTIAVADPDDRLFDAVLMKQFEDRQILPHPTAFAYLRGSIDRSFEDARAAVAAIDAEALSEGREITRALIREALDKAGLLRR